MAASTSTYYCVANEMNIGPSTVQEGIRSVTRAICVTHRHVLRLPTYIPELAGIMKGLQGIAGLPYCIGEVEGSHISWKGCPKEQNYEYRCYKGFESVVLFALSMANRRIIYADVGLLGVLGDGTIRQKSKHLS